jgi:phosphoglycerol transferase
MGFYDGWQFWLTGGIFSFFLASILLSGWPQGLTPNLSYPYSMGGDTSFMNWGIQRLIEGWIFDNSRSGYPFGSNFRDYPGSDIGNFLLLKILGMLFGSHYAATNLFFLLSFPCVTIVTFAVLRSLKLNKLSSITGALLFAFAPFHFLRMGHLTYCLYFVVPIFFYIALQLFFYKETFPEVSRSIKLKSVSLQGVGIVVLSSFGVYYSLFGMLVILAGAAAGWVRTRNISVLKSGCLVSLAIILGVLINISPNLIFTNAHNKNKEVAIRLPAESEIYGLKLAQLVLPRPSHRIQAFSEKTNSYNSTAPLVNENRTSSIGAVGALGLLILFFCLLLAALSVKIDDRLKIISVIGLILFLFGTIGGLGSLFALFISPSIRAWNRISIFISFATIAIFFITLQLMAEKYWRFNPKMKMMLMPSILLIVGAGGILDQTTSACKECNENTKNAFLIERNFIENIERAIPKGSAVYQLPYIKFPEAPPLNNLREYDHLQGFAHSKDLLWNSGGMKGREGDIFYKQLSLEAIEAQIDIIQKMGFSGIYIDKRGYKDGAQDLLSRLTSLLGEPSVTRGDGLIVFYKIKPSTGPIKSPTTPIEISEVLNYNPGRYKSKFEDGIQFSREGLPEFIAEVNGLSDTEKWGRWSDASISPMVKIKFNSPLPPKFQLQIEAISFNKNDSAPVKFQVGNVMQSTIIHNQKQKPYVLNFINSTNAKEIIIIPPYPISPKELDSKAADHRKLGVGLISIKINQPEN